MSTEEESTRRKEESKDFKLNNLLLVFRHDIEFYAKVQIVNI
jgi:hypothetical protein